MRACLLVILAAGCGSVPPPGGPIGSDGAGLSLTVSEVNRMTQIGGVSPASNRRFIKLSVSIENVGRSTLSIAFPLFAVQTSTGVRVQSTSSTALLARRCAEDQSLAPGGSTLCDLAFEVPIAEKPVALSYLDPKTSATSTASLPAESAPSLLAACMNAAPYGKNAGVSGSPCASCVISHCKIDQTVCTQKE